MDMLTQLSMAGIVPVIKIEDAACAVPLCQALSDGGLPVAEITFRTDAAEESIRLVSRELPDVLLGAGTVLTAGQAQRAIDAGARYIVSPGINPEVVKFCQSAGVPVLPGCVTPTEIETALSLGLKTVKFFPAEAVGGLPLIKALAAPYGGVSFVPTGGINEQNLMDYLSFPKVIACGGSWMVPDAAVKAGDWDKIRKLTSSAVDAMLGFELRHLGLNASDESGAAGLADDLGDMLGWPVIPGNSSIFVSTAFEVMKKQGRGAHGHIAIGTSDVARARWHMERRGYSFIEESAAVKNGRLIAIYFEKEIGGFAIHLVQK